MPSSFGIFTSMIATSGRSERASSTASSPSRASAQTSKPDRSRRSRRSSRMIVSSSATRTRMRRQPYEGWRKAVACPMVRAVGRMSEDSTRPFVFRVEIAPEQVDAIAPRLREALAASGNDGDITRLAAEVAEREEKLRRDQEELEQRARQLMEREPELGSSDQLSASERLPLAPR